MNTPEANCNDTPKKNEGGSSRHQQSILNRDLKIAGGAGLAVVLLIVVGSLVIGYYSGAESRRYVETIMSTSRYLCSGVMTATATILALMLTLLGLSLKSDTEMEDVHYRRIQRIAFYDMLLLSIATSWLMLMCIPIHESHRVPNWWYPALYYLLLGMAALMGGGLVSIVVMLYTTIRDLIEKICLN